MKKADLIKKLSGMTKISADKLKEAFNPDGEEIDVEIEELHTFTDDELESLKANMKKEGGKVTLEMAVKEQRNKLIEKFGEDLNFTGKTMENLVEAILKAGQKEAGKTTDEQVKEKEKIISQLQDNLKKAEAERDTANQTVTTTEFRYTVDSTLAKNMPDLTNSILSADDYKTLFTNKGEIVKEDGVLTQKRNGEIERDKLGKPVPLDTQFKTFINEKGVIQREKTGRGEGDKSGKSKMSHADIKTGADYYKHIEENKLNNEEQVKLLREIYKENPQFKIEE
jgi:hypothetical protein